MTIAVLFPRGVGEELAGWETRSRLRRGANVSELVYYDEDEPARDVIADVTDPYVLVVLDPLIVVEGDLADRLRAELEQRGGPTIADSTTAPLLYLCSADLLRGEKKSLRAAIAGREVLKSAIEIRRWQRETGPDLLASIPMTARSLLHVGCGDGTLGEQIRKRQRCRVVGIESDRDAAAMARRRLDDVYIGEIAQVVEILDETFECVVIGPALQQSPDPWALLAELRRRAASNGTLVASIPNIGYVRVVSELLNGHFDAARQMRGFTRESIEELIDIAGWELESITPSADSGANEGFADKLRIAGLASHPDLLVASFIVIARRVEASRG